MKAHPFTLDFESLPDTLPIFPLSGCVLLPLGQLQLNIFEPRYLNMIFDALGAGRLFGILQPDQSSDEETLYSIGCAGRISAFSETPDGRLLINLTGVCRFDIKEEIATIRGYRRFLVDWQRFKGDMYENEAVVNTVRLVALLDDFFKHKHIRADMKALKKLSSAALVNSLATNLPFAAIDKQTLVEAMTLADRTELLVALAQMSMSGQGAPVNTKH